MKQIDHAQIAAQQVLWHKGILRWKLDSSQVDAYDLFYSTEESRIVLDCGRRWGKSWVLITLGVETALRIDDAQIYYVAPSQKQVKKIIVPIFKQFFADCPKELRPEWKAQQQIYVFPNGSVINIAGMDADRGDASRGTDSHLNLIDEAGFSSSEYVKNMVENVLDPMTWLTNAKTVIASTPPKVPRHQFQKYYIAAKEAGAAIRKTIYDCPRLTKRRIEQIIKDHGGVNSTSFRREALAEFVIDESLLAIPEFTEDAQKILVTENFERPDFFDSYTSMDVGLRDATGILVGNWDFRKARLIIEDEVLLHGVAEVITDNIAKKIEDLEEEHYNGHQPYFRISDINLLLINDLDKTYHIKFHPTDKKGYSLEGGVNNLRLLIKREQLIINPRCVHLIAQLESCIWNKNRDDFDRVEGLYHFDLVASLIYLIHGLRRQHNPYPAERYDTDTQFFKSQPSTKTPTGQTFANIFKKPNFD